ncbi:hypothetical protein KSS87_002359, partial [Heliosperma pusillum]
LPAITPSKKKLFLKSPKKFPNFYLHIQPAKMEYDDPRLFDGIRFFLAGFDPIKHQEVKSKIVSKGGVYVAKYPSDCTHVIIHEIILDDPVCVAARRDKKILVSSLWIDHSIDAGVLVDAYNVSSLTHNLLKCLHVFVSVICCSSLVVFI